MEKALDMVPAERVSRLFLTVPTAGSHPDLLDDLVRVCGVPPERIIVVVTRGGVRLPPGVVALPCLDVFNIQHWWNLGIEEAVRRGADVVAVSNDDVRLAPATLPTLLEALESTGATVAGPGPAFLHVRRHFPFSPMLDGALWLVDVHSGLRPDERFVWWYGDRDIDLRARRDFNGVVHVPVEFENVHGFAATSTTPALLAHAAKDERTFNRVHVMTLFGSRTVHAAFRLKERLAPWLRRSG